MNSLRRLWALIALDLLIWRRMPMLVIGALIPPAGMALLIVMLTFSVSRQPVALVADSGGHYAKEFAKLIEADDDAYFLTRTDQGKAKRMLQEQRVAAIISIPADFDRSITTHSATVDLTLNNIDIDFADDIRRSVDRSVGQFDGMRLGREKPDAGEENTEDKSAVERPEPAEIETGKEPERGRTGNADWKVDVPDAYHIGIEEHDLRVTNVDFLHYQVVPALVLLVLTVGMLGTATLCAADRERGSLRMLLTAPVSSTLLISSRLLSGAIASAAVLAVAMAICFLTHAISPPPGHLAALSGLFLCSACCASGMGAALGNLMRGQQNIALASTLLASYLFFMGGGFTTIAFLPHWLRLVSALDPIRFAIDGVRQALFYPDLTGVAQDMLVLIGAAVAALLIGAAAVSRSFRA